MLNFLKRVLNFLFRSKKRYPKNIGKKVIISKDCTFSHPENVIINDYVYIGPRARVSSFGKVVFGKGVIIGPDLVIHTANHNYQNDIKTIPYDVGLNIKDVVDADFSEAYPNYLDLEFSGKKRKDLVQLHTKKASCLTASMYKGQISSFCKNENGEIYKYTPQDCEVLQTVPKNYTDCVSNTQRYKMLGNGWTVDVIAHIFKNISLT